ncbi:MAG: hypothetical protein AAF847_20665, partial [Bacteroidota bacterium]
MTQSQIKALISKGDTQKSIDLLLAATRNDSSLYNQVIQTSSRFAAVQKKSLLGTESSENIGLENRRITQALISIADQLPPNVDVTLPVSGINYGNDQKDTPSTPPVQTRPDPTASLTKFAPWIGVLLLIAGSAAALFLCTDGMGYFAVLVLLALGAGGVATILPGTLNVQAFNEKVSAVGAMALVVLIFTLSPAQDFIKSSNNCNKQTDFDLTIQLERDRALNIPAQYPPLKEAVLKIYPKDEVKEAAVPNNRSVTFKNLTVEPHSEAKIELLAKYWQLKESKTTLRPDESVFLAIVPDGSLGKVSGRVEDSESQPITAAEVDL